MKRRLIEAGVGLGIGGLLMAWVLRGLDWGALSAALQRSSSSLLLAGLSMTAAHLLRAWRWQLMLRSSQIAVDFAPLWWGLMVGYLVNTALPRVGEVARCTLIWRWRKVPFPTAIGTVIAERLTDVIILLLLATVVVGVEGPGWLHVLGWESYTLYIVGGSILMGVIGIIVLRYVLDKHAVPWLRSVLHGFESLWNTRPRWLMLVLSVSIWVGYGGAILGVMVLCSDSSWDDLVWPSWVLLTGSGLAMAIPVPGGIGTFHAIGMVLLLSLGWDESPAKITVFAAHALQTLLVLVLGFVGVLWGSGQRRAA
ncbi:MAG: flippase-like domain-containing protein [Bacteroidia bacterium]|nr:flippase-like domain-containing protein [Bacteroidia bacterium]